MGGRDEHTGVLGMVGEKDPEDPTEIRTPVVQSGTGYFADTNHSPRFN